MIDYKDFIPKQTAGAGFFSAAEYQTFDAAVLAANKFADGQSARILNIETVVLPNVWGPGEDGTTDPSIRTSGDFPATWHQFIRVWYER